MHNATNSVLNHFEKQAPSYDVASRRGLWSWQRRREAAAVFNCLGEVHDRCALDLGCGGGFYARTLVEMGACDVVAVDLSPSMLATISSPSICCIPGDAATVDLGRRFDRVVIAGVLEFVGDPATVLTNARRHVTESGRCAVLVPPAGLPGELYALYHRRNGLRIRLFTPSALANIAREAGWHVRESRPVWPHAWVARLEPME